MKEALVFLLLVLIVLVFFALGRAATPIDCKKVRPSSYPDQVFQGPQQSDQREKGTGRFSRLQSEFRDQRDVRKDTQPAQHIGARWSGRLGW